MIRLLLVDDQPIVRQGLMMRLALESDVTVVGEAGDGAAALALAREQCPDVVVMDVEMPVMDGIAATVELRRLAPRIVVVTHSMHDDVATKQRSSAAGAAAFVAKSAGSEALLETVRRVTGAA